MDCKEVSAALFLFFDNEMDEARLTPFRDHVGRCGHCAKFTGVNPRPGTIKC